MQVSWLIEKKRDGEELSAEEIAFLVRGYTAGEIPDYQMSALAMAIYFQDMTFPEIRVLTEEMMNSGDLVDTSKISKPKLDKHSTGGIGDKVSLVLAPLAACFDLAVPMISGRGLGVTGGTLDKLEAIPGYRCDLSEDEFIKVVNECGCSITGQTKSLAPADKKLYALRDVTGTVPSIPLITSSIMSKKLAAGIDGLVLDVKFGRGAFMREQDQAKRLAKTMTEVGKLMGRNVSALLTDMNVPLGESVGNACEVEEAIQTLQGQRMNGRFTSLCLELVSEMLYLSNDGKPASHYLPKVKECLESGRAFERFQHMTKLHSGDLEAFSSSWRSGLKEVAYTASESGYVSDVDALELGKLVVELGGGRQKIDDSVDHGVGLIEIRPVGEKVNAGDALCKVLVREDSQFDSAKPFLNSAFSLSTDKPKASELIAERL